MAPTPRYYHHGGSPAAWTGSAIAAIGFIIITIGVFMGPNWIVTIVGGVIVLLGGVATMVMKAMGLGQP
ncbi:MAG: hypothetical protein GX596_07330 [Propionibacterium sp.]|nr:hypothetical protein [Propionibacterium sp.]